MTNLKRELLIYTALTATAFVVAYILYTRGLLTAGLR
jgi:hypothetical protein